VSETYRNNCAKCDKFMDEEKVILSVTKFVDGCWKSFCTECVAPNKFVVKPIELKVYSGGGVPDVYWDGKPEENLANDPVTDKPIVFLSKGQKAEYLRSKGIMEAGDRVHGAPVSIYKNQERKAVDSRHEVQMALKKVKEMGRDRRRQEYLRIVNENRRHA